MEGSFTNLSFMSGSDASSVEDALRRLEEVDDLLLNARHEGEDEDEADRLSLSTYLNSNRDFDATLQQQDAELRELCDQFIQLQVSDADKICQLYTELSECEKKLVDFETEIVSFQRKLGGTAADIVNMQQQTDTLARSVDNRKQVSDRINAVYTALQECDAFCMDMGSKGGDVDQAYLAKLRELDHKLAFLSNNKALQNSAVDNETRPKLTAAAQRAGDKLKRYLSRSFEGLAAAVIEDPASLRQQQQALEQNAQFAFRFLLYYNEPVARDLRKLYGKGMADAFHRRLRPVLRELAETSEVHAHPLDPIVTAEEVTDVVSNRDLGAPSGCQVQSAPVTFPGRTLARRERSVSQHMRGLTDLVTGGAISSSSAVGAVLSGGFGDANIRTLRQATFQDTVAAVNALNVRHGRLQLDPAAVQRLDQCNSWSWRFVKCLQGLVDTCVSECRFIGNFFCVSGDVEGGENYSAAEPIAQGVLGRMVASVETTVQEDIPLVVDRVELLAALRAIEIAKQYLCTSLDPIPLMLLSGILELSKSSLMQSLRAATQNDMKALNFVRTLKLTVFRRAPDTEANAQDLRERSKEYGAAFSVHPVVLQVGEVLGKMEYMNNVPFRASTFATLRAYDRAVATFLHEAIACLVDFVQQLADRHASRLAQHVFSTVNLFAVLSYWSELVTLNPMCSEAAVSAQQADVERIATSLPGSASVMAGGSLSVSGGGDDAPTSASPTGSAAMMRMADGYAAPLAHVQLLEARFTESAQAWVLEDARGRRNAYYDMVRFIKDVERTCGANYFESIMQPQGAGSADGGSKDTKEITASSSIGAPRALQVATRFSAGWAEELAASLADIHKLASIALSGAALTSGATGRPPLSSQQRQKMIQELVQVLHRTYFQTITDTNAKFTAFVTRNHEKDNTLLAKLVSNVTLVHEAQKRL